METEWGFDLTLIGDGKKGAATFKRILKECDLPLNPRHRADGQPFVWKRIGLTLVTGNNPITGEYIRAGQRENELGYASYIGITGFDLAVEKLAS